MDTYVIFGIVTFALAVVLFGSLLLFRRGREGGAGASVGGGGGPFRDCYDLCTQDSKLASDGCATMCATQGSP